MKRSYVLTGLGLVAAIALISTAIASSGDSGKGSPAQVAAKKGRRGPPGPAGPPGPPGTNGTNGATSVTVRTTSLFVGTNSQQNATASCAGNERATGGGSLLTAGSAAVLGDRPSPTSGTPTGWNVEAHNGSLVQNATFTVYVICAAP